MRRPVILEISNWSSMTSCTTESSFSFRDLSMSSSMVAWGTVRGKPSNTNLTKVRGQHSIEPNAHEQTVRLRCQQSLGATSPGARAFEAATRPLGRARRYSTGAKATYPFLQALLFSSWSLIMPTTMSSPTRPPASMTFFASTPSFVLRETWSRSKSPVAMWQTQNSSRMRGACVPLPVVPRRCQGRACLHAT